MNEEVATVGAFDNRLDAEFAMDMLKEQGISAYLIDDDAGGLDPALQLTQPVRLIVKRHDLDRVRQILGDQLGN